MTKARKKAAKNARPKKKKRLAKGKFPKHGLAPAARKIPKPGTTRPKTAKPVKRTLKIRKKPAKAKRSPKIRKRLQIKKVPATQKRELAVIEKKLPATALPSAQIAPVLQTQSEQNPSIPPSPQLPAQLPTKGPQQSKNAPQPSPTPPPPIEHIPPPTEVPKIVLIQPKEYPKAPAQPLPQAQSQVTGLLDPALELLPEWEDRLRLRRIIFEDGLVFLSINSSSPEYADASKLLSMADKEAHADMPGYFIVCVKDRSGSVAGALDGHFLPGGVLFINRSCVRNSRKRELHILLYAAALAGRQVSYVAFSISIRELSKEMAGSLILLGRGFGMSALPPGDHRSLLLLRRIGRELDPMSSGQEISNILRAVAGLVDNTLYPPAAFERKGAIALIPLPVSPDTREHLHELRDFVSMAGLPQDRLDSVIEALRTNYVLERKDISPDVLF